MRVATRPGGFRTPNNHNIDMEGRLLDPTRESLTPLAIDLKGLNRVPAARRASRGGSLRSTYQVTSTAFAGLVSAARVDEFELT
jgi:hypothetical protein